MKQERRRRKSKIKEQNEVGKSRRWRREVVVRAKARSLLAYSSGDLACCKVKLPCSYKNAKTLSQILSLPGCCAKR